MSRSFVAAAAQLGPIARRATRVEVVARMVALIEEAARGGIRLVVFPEMALTTFFPRWLIEDAGEVQGFFERAMPSNETRPLFDAAAKHGIGFYLGYCEAAANLAPDDGDHVGYNTSILVDGGEIVGRYRKVHVPGNAAYDPELKLQHLERWYFREGDLGFPVFEAFGGRAGMLICNDRRWPEAWRMLGLQGVELVCLGFNSPAQLPDNPAQNEHRVQHHLIPMQAAAYQNGTWIIATAKAGPEEGCDMMGHSCIIAPSGEVMAMSSTLGDELVVHTIDLDATAEYKRFFDFATYRRAECYGLLTQS